MPISVLLSSPPPAAAAAAAPQPEETLSEPTETVTTVICERPRRPLSAYNLFFKDERVKLLKDRPVRPEGVPVRRGHGKMGFAEMARAVSAKWKAIDSETKQVYEELAKAEKREHKKKLAEWKRIVKLQEQQVEQQQQQQQEETSGTTSPGPTVAKNKKLPKASPIRIRNNNSNQKPAAPTTKLQPPCLELSSDDSEQSYKDPQGQQQPQQPQISIPLTNTPVPQLHQSTAPPQLHHQSSPPRLAVIPAVTPRSSPYGSSYNTAVSSSSSSSPSLQDSPFSVIPAVSPPSVGSFMGHNRSNSNHLFYNHHKRMSWSGASSMNHRRASLVSSSSSSLLSNQPPQAASYSAGNNLDCSTGGLDYSLSGSINRGNNNMDSLGSLMLAGHRRRSSCPSQPQHLQQQQQNDPMWNASSFPPPPLYKEEEDDDDINDNNIDTNDTTTNDDDLFPPVHNSSPIGTQDLAQEMGDESIGLFTNMFR